MKYVFVGIMTFVLVTLFGGERFAMGQSKDQGGKVDKISDEMLDRLAGKRILFGHKSVGYNILEGVEEIKGKDPRFKRLAVVEIKPGDPVTFEKPGIYHQQNGKNGFPKEKCDGFKWLLTENGVGGKVDIAFFKFCYVDFTPESNVAEIFNYYVETIESLKKAFPKLTIAHVTVPLVAHRWGFRSIIRNLTEGDPANVKRNEFNRMLIAKYGGRDVIYDLAAIESTYPDGKRESFKEGGKEYSSLIRDYTGDGGHLNAQGRYFAATEFVKVLADVGKK
jgi:hypothetical protein